MVENENDIERVKSKLLDDFTKMLEPMSSDHEKTVENFKHIVDQTEHIYIDTAVEKKIMNADYGEIIKKSPYKYDVVKFSFFNLRKIYKHRNEYKNIFLIYMSTPMKDRIINKFEKEYTAKFVITDFFQFLVPFIPEKKK